MDKRDYGKAGKSINKSSSTKGGGSNVYPRLKDAPASKFVKNPIAKMRRMGGGQGSMKSR